MDTQELENIFLQAMEDFPFPNLQWNGNRNGDLEYKPNEIVEFCAAFTFDAGMLVNKPVEGSGWIELYIEIEDMLEITGLFKFALEGDWENKELLEENTAYMGWYDVNARKWFLEIGNE